MFIYKTTNLVNGKYYIGKYAGKRSTYLGSGVALQKAIDKYGKNNFKRIILEKCSTLTELAYREKYWIELFDAVNDPRSYNIAEGGCGGFSYITKQHYKDNLDKKYGPLLDRPINAISRDYKKEFVVDNGKEVVLITGMDKVCNYLGMSRGQVHNYLLQEGPTSGYKFNSLEIDYYKDSYYLIDGVRYGTSKEVCERYNISKAVLSHRCLKSDRVDWWRIVEVKDKWKLLDINKNFHILDI